MIDIQKIKKDFPILSQEVNGKPLVYLDSGATSQKPKEVIESLVNYYQLSNANIHRGIHTLGDESTRLYQQSRKVVADFIGAGEPNELLFVRNTTEAINLVAYAWGRKNISKDDTILLTEMEHHSNVVPWQVLAEEVGARIKYVSVDSDGILDMNDFDEKISKKPKLLAMVHVSNFLGTINPVKDIIGKAKNVGTKVLIDGAQAIPHMKVDVVDLGADFYAFSGHKMLAPMGIGGLYIRKAMFEEMEPFLFGGGMISEVHKSGPIFANMPDRYDGGTPNVAGAVGMAVAVKYLKRLEMENVRNHEKEVLEYAMKKLSEVKGLKIYGPKDVLSRGGVIAFTLDKIHAHDVAQILDREMGVAVRSGYHCTMIMHEKLGVPATTRVSLYIYNGKQDVDTLIEGIEKVKKVFGDK